MLSLIPLHVPASWTSKSTSYKPKKWCCPEIRLAMYVLSVASPSIVHVGIAKSCWSTSMIEWDNFLKVWISQQIWHLQKAHFITTNSWLSFNIWATSGLAERQTSPQAQSMTLPHCFIAHLKETRGLRWRNRTNAQPIQETKSTWIS